jgi:hypothetical protein
LVRASTPVHVFAVILGAASLMYVQTHHGEQEEGEASAFWSTMYPERLQVVQASSLGPLLER